MRGVNAYLSDGGSEVEAVPSLAYFNHMILVVKGDKDDDLIWLDPTAETCAFGDLPAGDQDRWTLIINPRFLETESDPKPLKQDIWRSTERTSTAFRRAPLWRLHRISNGSTRDVKVKKDLSVSVRQELTVTGQFQHEIAEPTQTPSDRRRKIGVPSQSIGVRCPRENRGFHSLRSFRSWRAN